jgi:hypothetical protein
MADNAFVSIDNIITAELHEAAERASKKVRDRDAMRCAAPATS